MPLIKCPECENEMSDKVDTVCPKCGYKHDKNSIAIIAAKNRTQSQCFWLIMILNTGYIFFTIFVLGLFGVKGGGLVFGSILLLSACFIVIVTNSYIVKKTRNFFILWNSIWLLIIASGVLYKI